MAGSRRSFPRGSILGNREPEVTDERDMTQRVVDRALAKNKPITPTLPEENKQEASILHYVNNASNEHSDIASLHHGIIASNKLASNDYSDLTLSDYNACALPTGDEAVAAFVVAAGKVKTQNVTIRLSTALDILVSRVAGGHVAVRKIYKSDFIRRCIQLGLYELYTGKRLVTLGDEEADESQ